MALQEVRFRNEGVKTLRGGEFECSSYWKGEDTEIGGIGLTVKYDLAKSVMDVRRINPKISSVDLVLCSKVVTIISAYGPQSGQSEEDKNCFYDDLSAEMQSKNGNCIALKDFNGHVGNSIDGCERLHGRQGWGIRNKDGERLLELADSFDMGVGNTFFKRLRKADHF